MLIFFELLFHFQYLRNYPPLTSSFPVKCKPLCRNERPARHQEAKVCNSASHSQPVFCSVSFYQMCKHSPEHAAKPGILYPGGRSADNPELWEMWLWTRIAECSFQIETVMSTCVLYLLNHPTEGRQLTLYVPISTQAKTNAVPTPNTTLGYFCFCSSSSVNVVINLFKCLL